MAFASIPILPVLITLKSSVSPEVTNLLFKFGSSYKLKSNALYETSLLVNANEESDRSKYIFKFFSIGIGGLIGDIVPAEALVILITSGCILIAS